MNDPADTGMEAVRDHLRGQYEGVFAPGQVERHVEDYVALDPVRPLVEIVEGRIEPGSELLDVGCGYGSFVTVAREQGFDARGVELAEFEVSFARERLASLRPGDDPEHVFVRGDAHRLPFDADSFDAVTLWNVIEHVPRYPELLASAARLLRPGGRLFAIAPNYAAFRREAHYHVPWAPLLPRRLASRYLALIGRDPEFFETSIYYCTNRGVRRALRDAGLEVVDRRAERLADPARLGNAKVRAAAQALSKVGAGGLAPALARAVAANPLAPTISVEALKAPQYPR